ncbi:MAG: serine/threonine protein kinase [Lentisphaeria bacterium]|nr:serine/threonine protein kinase [Lentisphaeria bacterium]
MELQENNADISPADLLGAEIDGYRLVSVLGYGSYGVVFLARHLLMDRCFALKILQAEFAENSDAVKEFFHESKMAAKLEHPNIVQAFKAGKTADGVCYFVMEYVDGCSIEDIRVNSPELLSIAFLLEISIQLADALQYAWDRCGMTHRDIKPGNLLIRNADRKLKLADLGLAATGTAAGDEIVATPLYMSPEVAGGKVTVAMTADIYSFGVMFYELSSGIPPFTGSVEELHDAHLNKLPPPLLSVNPDLPAELASFIDSMLAKDPAARPQNWQIVKKRFAQLKDAYFYHPPAAAAAPEICCDGKEALQKKNPLPGYIILAAVLIVILLALVIFVINL